MGESLVSRIDEKGRPTRGQARRPWYKAWPSQPYTPWDQRWAAKSFAVYWAVFLVAKTAEWSDD
jgi:hypothetical protein